MAILSDSEAKRGGSTARYWYETVHSISLTAAEALRFAFSISGNKGGQTNVQLDIGPEDFPTVLETMCIVDRQAAMQAMAIELSRQIQTQPERDQRLTQQTRSQTESDIQSLARDKYDAKPHGEDERERTVMNGVDEIIRELRSRE